MARQNKVPAYRRHKGTGYAYVYHRSIQTKDHRLYIGKHGTEDSRQRYRQFLERLAANQGGAELPPIDPVPTINEVVLAWIQYGKAHYRRGDGLSSQYHAMRRAIRFLTARHGLDLAKSFGPKLLKDLRKSLIPRYDRSYVNQIVARLQRLFQWASSEELVPPHLYHGLLSVKPLAKGELGAWDKPPVTPADFEQVRDLLPFLSPTVAALVQVQYLCCMRPREACIMRGCDIDRSGDIWLYRPHTHKNEWRGQSLVKAIPKAAQRIIAPFLEGRAPDAYLFSPRDAAAWATDLRRANRPPRTTHLYPSEARRVAKAKRLAIRRHSPIGTHYKRDSYMQAIEHGIAKAAKAGVTIERFCPRQLRHSMVTYVAKTLGAQPAQRFAGHASLSTTNLYAEIEVSELIDIARQLDLHNAS